VKNYTPLLFYKTYYIPIERPTIKSQVSSEKILYKIFIKKVHHKEACVITNLKGIRESCYSFGMYGWLFFRTA